MNWMFDRFGSSTKWYVSPKVPALCFALMLLLFGGLVAGGITGSSLGALYKHSVVSIDGLELAGSPKAIRSDEWGVITPMAIGQTYHHPRFPVLNRNIGPEGQNMLIVGMSGVPVAHLSAIAKPATWGFHLFDLKRALAWYWWFPLFGCWFALWWMLCLLMPGRPIVGLLISTLFISSPYVVAWSYWPAYAVFLPAFSLCIFLLILKHPGRLTNFLLGGVLGVSLAGFVLLLYPPQQVSLGFLFLMIAGAQLWDRRHALSINLVLIGSLLVAVTVTSVILWHWWLDAGDAVMAMLDTLYPGRRVSDTGGGFSLSVLLRGFTNLTSLYAVDFGGGPLNQSEAASFHYLILPLLVALWFQAESAWKDHTTQALLLFFAWSLFFVFVGIPEPVAKLSLWGRVPSIRVDLCLGLAYTLLCGQLLMRPPHGTPLASQSRMWTAGAVSLVWVSIVAIAVSVFPDSVQGGWGSWAKWVTLGLAFLSGVWLISGKGRMFISSCLLLALLTVLRFHPLSVGPSRVQLKASPNPDLAVEAQPLGRVLVIGNHFQAMALMSAGIPVVNGIHYYPQAALWKRLDPTSAQRDVHNRYQHLSFDLGTSVAASGLDLKTPVSDQVQATLDPAKFDFRDTTATHVLAPRDLSEALERSGQLAKLSTSGDWCWWLVQPKR